VRRADRSADAAAVGVACRPQSGNIGRVIPSPSELAGFWSRLADLDADIRRCHAEGYETEVDRLLDERTRWQQERDELFRGLPRAARRS
jgi:hypothetical protein